MSELHDLASAYVLGALDESDTARFESHLDDCDLCRSEIATVEQGVIAMAAQGAEHPSGQVRDAVIAGIGGEAEIVTLRAKRAQLGYLIPAVAATVILIVGFGVVFGSDPVARVLDADDAVVAEFSTTEAYPAADPEVAHLVLSESEGAAVVEFEGLSGPGIDSVYQLWIIDGELATAAGLFSPDADGSATVLLSGSPTSGETVGITLEPFAGSTTPTGSVLFAADI